MKKQIKTILSMLTGFGYEIMKGAKTKPKLMCEKCTSFIPKEDVQRKEVWGWLTAHGI